MPVRGEGLERRGGVWVVGCGWWGEGWEVGIRGEGWRCVVGVRGAG